MWTAKREENLHTFVLFGAFPDGGSAPDPSPATTAERLLEGPPRIAPLWTDLEPPAATGAGEGVYVRFLPHRLRVSWHGVPEAGTDHRVTFQVTLFDSGRITFAYGTPQGRNLEPEELLALDEALAELARRDPRPARIVELRFFAGLMATAVARLLGCRSAPSTETGLMPGPG